jgi:sialic acid synthase SpsE
MGAGGFMQHIAFGGRRVGEGEPCFLIAEIGANHNRDFDMARRLIDVAADAGADCVKFQIFLADQHYSRFTPPIPGYDKHIHTIIAETEFDRDWLPLLKDFAEERGVVFLSSVGDRDAISRLEAVDVVGYKNTSAELSDVELISAIAATGKPVILSTGLADEADITRALAACEAAGNRQVILLQCSVAYPAPMEIVNLRAMETMRNRFGTLVGFSDHTLGDHVAVAAVAMGARVVEKHITLDRALPGPDHRFALEPDELAGMVRRIRDVEAALGDGRKDGPRGPEMDIYLMARRSLHAAVDIPKGTVITEDMLCIKRPGMGIAPWRKSELLGRVSTASIAADRWITWEDVTAR